MSEIAKHWIDGEWTGSGTVRESVNPATGAVLGRWADGGEGEARAAVAAARRAFDTAPWSRAARSRTEPSTWTSCARESLDGPPRLPYSSSAEGFAVSPRLLAHGSDCTSRTTAQNLGYGGNFGYYTCRTLRVTDVRTGRRRTFAAPPGTSGWAPPHGGNWAWSGSEIAPSGQMMAAEAVIPPDSRASPACTSCT